MAHILVIDDDEFWRSSVRRILESRAHSVNKAQNSAKKLAVATVRTPDLVITDVFMPNRDGIETLIELRRIFPALRVIAMSGGDGSGVMNLLDDMETLGAVQTLPKPFTPKELMAAVNACLPT
jgi:CheY-like chemotaxis protein